MRIIIPALGHQNKGKSSFTGSGLFVFNVPVRACPPAWRILYHVIASCKRPIAVGKVDRGGLTSVQPSHGLSNERHSYKGNEIRKW